MKKYLVIPLVLLITATIAQAQQFDLRGEISGQKDGKLNLVYQNKNGKTVSDTCTISNGAFEFKGDIAEPAIAYFNGAIKSHSIDDPNATSFFLEPTLMHIYIKAGDFKNAKITGSKTQEEYAELTKQKQGIYNEEKPLSEKYSDAGDEIRKAEANKADDKTLKELKEKASAIQDQGDPYRKRIAQIDYKYFSSHPNSYLTAWDLRFYVSSLSLDSLQMFYNNMNTTLRQSSYGKYIDAELIKLRAGAPGSIAADFTAMDINGKQINLLSFKGKYVILDFWASWCVPCRHSNPHMIALYNKYHSKGLDVIGVASDDSHPDAWRKAVTQDSVGIWYNVLDGLDWAKINKGEKNDKEIGNKFGIHSLPTKIIIDPSGKIIGRYGDNIGGTEEDMDKLLISIFNKKT